MYNTRKTVIEDKANANANANRLKLELQVPSDATPVKDMKQGTFAVVVTVPQGGLGGSLEHMLGEIIFRNVAGWHGLTGDRYWPSDYALSNTLIPRVEYVPDFGVVVLGPEFALKTFTYIHGKKCQIDISSVPVEG